MTSFSLVAAVVTVQSSSPHTPTAHMVSTAVTVASAAPSRQPPLSAVGTSSVQQLPLNSYNVYEDLRDPMDLTSEQRHADTRLVTSRLVDLENICNALAVTSATIYGLN